MANLSWLLLVHQLPTRPAYLRVKVWRRLRDIGAVALRSAIYALPATPKSADAFEKLLRDIEKAGGKALLCRANLLDGLTDQQARDLFNAARDAEYLIMEKSLRAMGQASKRGKVRTGDLSLKLAKIRKNFADTVNIDFFGARGGIVVESLLSRMEHSHIARFEGDAPPAALPSTSGQTWVTRRGVHVDRIACAWLIRRFIDPDAKFKFVADKKYRPAPGALRFDMPNGEFTHEGDNCSFETLVARMNSSNPALSAIAQIVHDLDLKDQKFKRPESAGIGHILEGICMSQSGDLERIARGSILFDDAYERFRRKVRKTP
jgi:hypothetical protein